jgi:integrating conjugative element protein (TIGR03765 family)
MWRERSMVEASFLPRATLTMAVLGLAAQAALAASVEPVFDSGRSIPIAPYLAVPGSDGTVRGEQAQSAPSFPITSSLSRGVLPQEVAVFDRSLLTQALVVTGTDRHSMAWMLLHRERMAAVDAKVVVVQAHTPQHLALARSLLPELPMLLRTSTWLEQRLLAAGAGVYPVLIGTDGMARQILPMDAAHGVAASGGRP